MGVQAEKSATYMTLPKGDARRSWIKGSQHHSWRGGRQLSGNGAIQVIAHENPRSDSRGRMYEHILVAEAALGYSLPSGAEVHHVDRNRTNNAATNLVICENHAYHLFLHRRMRAYQACGRADWFKCRHCGKWDAPENMYVKERQHDGPLSHHRACHAQAARSALG